MAPLFSSQTTSADPSTSPKRRKGLLGRPSFFSRPSATSTAVSSTATLIPLEPTSSPISSSKAPLLTDSRKSIDISAFLSSRPPQPLIIPTDDDSAEQLQVSLLPSALSNTSIGPSSAPTGPTPSNSFGGISASTSRNTVLPASHPILSSSGSTFLPPSLSLGFELQETATALPTLASAIKLPSPARPDGAAGDKTGVESVITRKPVPGLSAEEVAANTTAPIPPMPIAAAPPTSTLPRSTSGTSIFGSSRLGRIASRSSIMKAPDSSNRTASGAGGMSLGRRISRRLSIDHIRPMFNGGSTKRRNAPQDGGGGGAKMDIQRWAQGAVSGAEAGEAPPIIPALTPAEQAEKAASTKVKERMVLPGIRTWRSKFSSSKIPPAKPKQSAFGGASYTESVRSQRLDSWVDVGSVRSNISGMPGSTRGLAGALRRMEAADSPATVATTAAMSVVEASEPNGVELANIDASAKALPSLPKCVESPLDPSARRSAALLDSLLARPSEDDIAAHPLAEPTKAVRATPGFTTSLSTSSLGPGFTTSISTSSLGPPANLMSPAADDKSLLEPLRSPMPELPIPVRMPVGAISEAEEIIRDVRESAGLERDTNASPTSPTPISKSALPHAESGLSFHTAQSSSDVSEPGPPIGLPRSRSKSVIDLPTSSSSLIERTEREQGEGWWSAPRPRPAEGVTRSAFLPKPESPLRPRRSEDRRRQSSASVLDGRRPIVASAVAKLESAHAHNSPRRSILRPSKLQFADADEDDVETPTRSTRRLARESGTPTRHRRESTTDSFSKLFYGPVMPSPVAKPVQVDELAKVKERHALELDALVSALSAAKAESSEMSQYATRAIEALKAEAKERELAQHRMEMLERKMEMLLQGNKEFGAELGTSYSVRPGSIRGRASALSTYDHGQSPSARRHRRGVTGDTDMYADEFGRLEGPAADAVRR